MKSISCPLCLGAPCSDMAHASPLLSHFIPGLAGFQWHQDTVSQLLMGLAHFLLNTGVASIVESISYSFLHPQQPPATWLDKQQWMNRAGLVAGGLFCSCILRRNSSSPLSPLIPGPLTPGTQTPSPTKAPAPRYPQAGKNVALERGAQYPRSRILFRGRGVTGQGCL